jgi:hypothetical protein
MQVVKRLFRNNYAGEDIYTAATYTNKTWSYDKEFVPRVLENQKFGGRAVVIGNGTSRLKFDLNHLQNKKVQTYGCNALYRDFETDFLIAVGNNIGNEITQSGYAADHVVYSTTDNIIKHPNTFHLIPQNPSWNAGAIATYLACFDGHATVYLLGHDGLDTPGYYNNVYKNTNAYTVDEDKLTDRFWALSMGHVFKTYNLVDFVLVNETGRGYIPKEWLGHTNLRRINFRELVLECDL